MKRIVTICTGFVVIALIFTIISCKKPYYPPAIKPLTGFLVVEGVINAGNDSTRFQLSRTVNLDSNTTAPVTGAQVTIEGSNNTTYALNGNAAGIYTSVPLNLDKTQTYRLHIITAKGENYLSDYVGVKTTPPIDTLQYQVESNGVQINLNTHDPANATRYYRWDFVETWEFHSFYYSDYVSNGNVVVPRTAAQQVYYCYTSANSNSVLIGSSAKLTQDVISAAPITFVPSNSEKLEVEYSIQVSQYALTSDAYNFWSLLKQDTEELGSIFDVQPSEINGNIHSTTNPGEHVIGYVSASTIQTKRIFIDNSVLPYEWVATYPYNCGIDSVFLKEVIGTVVYNEENEFFNYNTGGGALIPINAFYNKAGTLLGHTGSDPICVDCTVRGTTKQPSFWK